MVYEVVVSYTVYDMWCSTYCLLYSMHTLYYNGIVSLLVAIDIYIIIKNPDHMLYSRINYFRKLC